MKISKWHLLFIAFTVQLMLTHSQTFAQGHVYGNVYDDHKNLLSIATVRILRLKDSICLKAIQTDLYGHYNFDRVQSGNYLVAITMIGFKTKLSDPFIIDSSHKNIKIADIMVQTEDKTLGQIDITTKKLLIEHLIDRTILNVENSILASGSTALEVLQSAPGVLIDNQNDLIKLNNKGGVMVMIDGRKNYLSPTDLSNMLRNMSSDQIAKIEIITNPSAKYDASGNAGIINIKLKKNKFYGTNGSMSATIGNGFIPYGPDDLFRGSFNLNLNNRTEKWNTYININPSRSSDLSETTLHRDANFKNSQSVFDEYIIKPRTSTAFAARFGVDYQANNKTTLGILVDGGIFEERVNDHSSTFIDQHISGTDHLSSLVQTSNTHSPRRNVTSNFNIKHDLNKGAVLTFDATYSGYKNIKDQDFNIGLYDDNGNLNSTMQHIQTNSTINIFTAKADIAIPISESLKFEGGLKSDHVRTNNDDVSNVTGSNSFIYKEHVNSVYINFNKKWTNWGIQAGLRTEQTHSNGNSITLNKIADSNYVSLFPSVFVSQTIDKNNTLRYAYSRRIDRPNYQQLNPFVFYIDPYALDQGNPFIRPQFTDNFEISYTYKGSVNLSISYSKTTDRIVQLTTQNDSTRIIKAIVGNLGTYKNYSANLSFPLEISKWWTMQNQFNFFYNQYSDMGGSVGDFNSSKFSYEFNIFNSFKLSDKWGAEMSYNYISPYVYGVERAVKPNSSLNVGIQKSLFNNKAKIKFNISDIFLTSKYVGMLNYQNIDLSVLNRWTSRRANLSFIYNFGNKSIKSPRDRSTGAETLKNRAN